ncbi:MAG: glycosyltransferase [Candidatus Pacearchaeota archaeon]|jgi:glycosyltransferase involved in cell wall biosynthesis
MGKENEISADELNPKTCFFANYPPKECGIATFTKHLATAMDKKWNPKVKSRVIAINEEGSFYNYNKKVIFEVAKNDIEHYIEVAKKVNYTDNIKILCIQHEFGIFGGEYGNYIIPFLETVKKPVVVTFHTVLPEPDEKRKRVVQAIAKRSSALVVLAKIAADILIKDYDIEKSKIHVVYHGIENVPFQSNEGAKKRLKLDGKTVLLTYGLLGRGKGIEYMIRALPPLVEKYPNILYLIVGETHPAVRKEEGEKYRNELISLARKLKIENHVKFYNKYLPDNELVEYMAAADVYIGTNMDRNQISSGPLAEAIGGGKAVISTPSFCAEELLADRRGLLAEFRNPESFTKAIDKMLSNPEQKKEMERQAYAFSRQMTWPNVAIQYLRIFNKIVKLREDTTEKLPKVKLNHMINLTDDFGIIQFSRHSTPDKASGYTLDDNSRALIFSIKHSKLYNRENTAEISSRLTKSYIKFLEHCQEPDGNFKNNHCNEEEITNSHSEDSFGRAIWSLGFAINNSDDPLIKERAKKMFDRAFRYMNNLESPRAKAFCINGLYYYYKSYGYPEILTKLTKFANELVNIYDHESSNDWQWFEPYLTYSNSTLPEALFFAYELTGNEKYFEVAKKSLDFLTNLMLVDGEFCPIGQNGWYKRNGERAFFDQQPLDVSCIILTFLTAYSLTQEKEYYTKAILAFNWFLGKNHLKQMMYDETTGGCYDGLGKHSVNLNQGAESTISYLMARIFLEEHKRKQKAMH